MGPGTKPNVLLELILTKLSVAEANPNLVWCYSYVGGVEM
jgi:hypothetical protein